MTSEDRFDRNERLFGSEGQARLHRTKVTVIGVGGLGTHVVQQLALLGVGALTLVDQEELSLSDRNRYVGVRHEDPIPGLLKVNLGTRLIEEIDPRIAITTVPKSLLSRAGFNAARAADVVFGCIDHDGVRFVLNELCLAYSKPLFDLASDVPEPGRYGGRVVVVTPRETGCLCCRDLLDQTEIRRLLSPTDAIENEKTVYGIDPDALAGAGPSVVFVNGVVASLGVGEFAAMIAGVRAPYPHLEYRGHEGVVRRRQDRPASDCYYCAVVQGRGDSVELDRYLRPLHQAGE